MKCAANYPHPKCWPREDDILDHIPDYDIELIRIDSGYFAIKGVYRLWGYPSYSWIWTGCNRLWAQVQWRRIIPALKAYFPNATIAIARICSPAVPNLDGLERLVLITNARDEPLVESVLGPVFYPGSVPSGVLYAKSRIQIDVPVSSTPVTIPAQAGTGCPSNTMKFEVRAEAVPLNIGPEWGEKIPKRGLRNIVNFFRSQGACAIHVFDWIKELAYVGASLPPEQPPPVKPPIYPPPVNPPINVNGGKEKTRPPENNKTWLWVIGGAIALLLLVVVLE